MLRTDSVFAERSETDGTRIFTAGRETLDDGVTEHPLLEVGVGYDLWWPDLAPEGSVYWRWHQGRIDWEEFSAAYLEKLRDNQPSVDRMAALGELARKETVTVLCTEDSAHRCHRGLLVVEFQRNFPDLSISAG